MVEAFVLGVVRDGVDAAKGGASGLRGRRGPWRIVVHVWCLWHCYSLEAVPREATSFGRRQEWCLQITEKGGEEEAGGRKGSMCSLAHLAHGEAGGPGGGVPGPGPLMKPGHAELNQAPGASDSVARGGQR